MSSLSLLTSPLRARDRQDGSIFENDVQRRGFVIVIILSLLATVGMFCLIITLVLLKNKRDRRIKKAKMDAEKGSVWPGANKGRYQKVEEDKRDGVWSAEMEMEDRGAYSGAGYGEGREPYRPINTHSNPSPPSPHSNLALGSSPCSTGALWSAITLTGFQEAFMPARRGFHPCGETDEDRPILHSEAIEGAVEGVVNEAIDRYTGKKSKVRLKYEDIYEIVERVRKSQGRTSSKKPKQDGFKPFPKPRPAAPNPSTESCAAQAGDKKPNKKNMKRAKKPADHTANTTTTNAPEATEQDTKQTSFPDPASIPTATATLAPEAPDKHFIVRQTFYTNNWPSYTTTVHANICRPAARRYIMHRSQSLASTPVHYIVPGDGSSETQQSAKSVSVETMRKMVWFQSADGDDREVFGFEAWIEERKELVLRMWASVRGEKDLDEKDMEKMKKMDEKEMHAMYEKDMEKMKKMDEKEMHAMYEKEMEVAEKDMFEMFEKQRMDDMEEMQMEDMEEADMEEMFEAYEKEMQELEEMYAKQIEEMDEMEEGEGEEDEHKEEEEHKEDHEEEQKDEQKGEKEEDQEEEDQHGNQKKEGELVEELFNDDDEEGGVSLDLVWQDN